MGGRHWDRAIVRIGDAGRSGHTPRAVRRESLKHFLESRDGRSGRLLLGAVHMAIIIANRPVGRNFHCLFLDRDGTWLAHGYIADRMCNRGDLILRVSGREIGVSMLSPQAAEDWLLAGVNGGPLYPRGVVMMLRETLDEIVASALYTP